MSFDLEVGVVIGNAAQQFGAFMKVGVAKWKRAVEISGANAA